MKRVDFLLAPLALTACNQQVIVKSYCGQPSAIWTPAEDFQNPHLVIEHLIQITHANQILVNGEPSSIEGVEKFLIANTNTLAPTVYFDFDAHSDCKLVQDVRATVEKSGICTDKNCITGNDDEVPPPEPK